MLEMLMSSGKKVNSLNNLVAGDDQAGYFGRVAAADFITGTALSQSLGLITGTVINDSYGWLKFASSGKIIYIAQRPFRQNISWNDIYKVGAVHGSDDNGVMGPGYAITPRLQDAKVTIGGKTYRVRLIRQGTTNPLSGQVLGGEVTNVFSQAIETLGGTWDTLTMADIFTSVNSGSPGSFNWAMEYFTSSGSSWQAAYTALVSSLSANGLRANAIDIRSGWRPVLELIP